MTNKTRLLVISIVCSFLFLAQSVEAQCSGQAQCCNEGETTYACSDPPGAFLECEPSAFEPCGPGDIYGDCEFYAYGCQSPINIDCPNPANNQCWTSCYGYNYAMSVCSYTGGTQCQFGGQYYDPGDILSPPINQGCTNGCTTRERTCNTCQSDGTWGNCQCNGALCTGPSPTRTPTPRPSSTSIPSNTPRPPSSPTSGPPATSPTITPTPPCGSCVNGFWSGRWCQATQPICPTPTTAIPTAGPTPTTPSLPSDTYGRVLFQVFEDTNSNGSHDPGSERRFSNEDGIYLEYSGSGVTTGNIHLFSSIQTDKMLSGGYVRREHLGSRNRNGICGTAAGDTVDECDTVDAGCINTPDWPYCMPDHMPNDTRGIWQQLYPDNLYGVGDIRIGPPSNTTYSRNLNFGLKGYDTTQWEVTTAKYYDGATYVENSNADKSVYNNIPVQSTNANQDQYRVQTRVIVFGLKRIDIPLSCQGVVQYGGSQSYNLRSQDFMDNRYIPIVSNPSTDTSWTENHWEYANENLRFRFNYQGSGVGSVWLRFNKRGGGRSIYIGSQLGTMDGSWSSTNETTHEWSSPTTVNKVMYNIGTEKYFSFESIRDVLVELGEDEEAINRDGIEWNSLIHHGATADECQSDGIIRDRINGTTELPYSACNVSNTCRGVLQGYIVKPWIKANNASINKLNSLDLVFPKNTEIFDAADDTANRHLIVGSTVDSLGLVTANNTIQLKPFMGDVKTSAKDWKLRTYDFHYATAFNTHINELLKRRHAELTTFSNFNQLQNDSINVIDVPAPTPIVINNVVPNSIRNVVIIPKNGNDIQITHGSGRFNNNDVSLAILTKGRIQFGSNMSQVTGIFAADGIDFGYDDTDFTDNSPNTHLKIIGNISSMNPIENLQRNPTNLNKPTIFIKYRPDMYLDLLELLSTITKEGTQIE